LDRPSAEEGIGVLVSPFLGCLDLFLWGNFSQFVMLSLSIRRTLSRRPPHLLCGLFVIHFFFPPHTLVTYPLLFSSPAETEPEFSSFPCGSLPFFRRRRLTEIPPEIFSCGFEFMALPPFGHLRSGPFLIWTFGVCSWSFL